MDEFLDSSNLLKSNQEETNNLTRSIINKEIETAVKVIMTKEKRKSQAKIDSEQNSRVFSKKYYNYYYGN